ncbi:N-acetylglucosaminyl-phosphatidylinositol de-N-acetylase-like [Asterias rubens]|uniref:N-acetylglucosaminyl-phosphatidylinositol de-N-acetylase-like n=1 Tax=Asterias rubens TaxID=7604 RepID=UPI00145544CD|nr:N-acetylglucosaminyl-phosphatidylinositol de-N-acetylase-like [Asterias rubens]
MSNMAAASGMVYFFLPYTAISLLIYYVALRRKRSSDTKAGKSREVLVVTAHPDDECMFFAPTILQLVQEANTKLNLLCLSTGNYYNHGEVRTKELIASCFTLGLQDAENINVLNDERLKDGQEEEWDTDVIGHHVLQSVKKHNINMIVTFDASGVSGHKNHIACYTAVRNMVESGKLKKGTKLYFLQSVSIWRKYLIFLDIPFSILLSRHMFLTPPWNMWKSQRAMFAHASQLTWYRLLYIIFSRYMTVNGYHKKSVH